MERLFAIFSDASKLIDDFFALIANRFYVAASTLNSVAARNNERGQQR